MRPTTPLLAKTPFAIDPKPMDGFMTPFAGLCVFSRAFRSLKVPTACQTHVHIKQRSSGYSVAQQVESLVLLHIAGGDHMSDIELLRKNDSMQKMLGYQVPSQRCLADFLEAFHDHELLVRARQDAKRKKQLSFIPDEAPALVGLASVLQTMVRTQVATMPEQPTTATIDLDATIIESAKQQAQWTYEGTPGYQPLVAVWAETGLIVADEFRDGNVPAGFSPLPCTQAAFATLPDTVTTRYFRGDSACHEHHLLNWLRNPKRKDGPQGTILFAVSARMSPQLKTAVASVHDTRWTTFAIEKNGTVRQWAEIAYVPSERTEKKGIIPLRYIGLRILKPQGVLFADGSDRHHHAIITNRTEADGSVILNWHRGKAGTIEHVHDELKNGLGAGHLPSAKFGANAAWFRIACLAYNLLHAVRIACTDESLRNAKAKRIRFVLVNVTGRFSRDRRKISLHLAASEEWIQHLLKLFDHFPLRTQATG